MQICRRILSIRAGMGLALPGLVRAKTVRANI